MTGPIRTRLQPIEEAVAPTTAGDTLQWNGSAYVWAPASGGVSDGDKGDVTVSGGGTVWTIDNDVVSNAKLANVSTATLKGRVTAGTGDPEDLTGTQATTLLDVFTSALKGLAPASGGGTTNFLRADGTWAAPPGGGGGGANVGTATIDFGVFPGSSHATVAVTGQAGIVAGSVVQAWIRPVATADHSADEHLVETIRISTSNIVAGTGFTIHGFNISEKTNNQGEGTRIYGAWTVAWSWA